MLDFDTEDYSKLDEITYTNALSWFKELLTQENKVAKESGKPLLILIGEMHRSNYSAQVEAMILLIASTYLNVRDVMVELDSYRYYKSRVSGWLQYFISLGYFEHPDIPWKEIEDLSNKMKIEFHLIDKITAPIQDQEQGFLEGLEKVYFSLLPTLDLLSSPGPAQHYFQKQYQSLAYKHRFIVSEEGIKQRNNGMANEAAQINQSSIAIVGAAHLYGLLNETNLKQNFHVVPINTAASRDRSDYLPNYHKLCRNFCTNSRYVYQASDFYYSLGPLSYYAAASPKSKKELVAKIEHAHQNMAQPEYTSSLLETHTELLRLHNQPTNKKRKKADTEMEQSKSKKPRKS